MGKGLVKARTVQVDLPEDAFKHRAWHLLMGKHQISPFNYAEDELARELAT